MTHPVEFARTDDPLFRDVPLDHRVRLPVLGIPIRFASNAGAVIDVAQSAFGAWRDLPAGYIDDDDVQVTLTVHPGDEGHAAPDDGHAPLTHRVLPGRRVIFGSPGSMGIADPERREAFAWITPELVADREHFRYGVVEAMTMAVVTPLDRQPFHAACLARGGAALLLAGPSGVGKSTLSYAALRADSGITLLAEDTVFLQSRPGLRVWGLPGFLHLPTDLADRFPDLAPLSPAVRANGKTKLALDVGSVGGLPDLPVVERAAVCLLTRSGATPGVRRLSGAEVLRRLESAPRESGFDVFADTIGEPLAQLTRGGGWVLELPEDPRDAVPWLERMLEETAVVAS
jgi:hypothetical protein